MLDNYILLTYKIVLYYFLDVTVRYIIKPIKTKVISWISNIRFIIQEFLNDKPFLVINIFDFFVSGEIKTFNSLFFFISLNIDKFWPFISSQFSEINNLYTTKNLLFLMYKWHFDTYIDTLYLHEHSYPFLVAKVYLSSKSCNLKFYNLLIQPNQG